MKVVIRVGGGPAARAASGGDSARAGGSASGEGEVAALRDGTASNVTEGKIFGHNTLPSHAGRVIGPGSARGWPTVDGVILVIARVCQRRRGTSCEARTSSRLHRTIACGPAATTTATALPDGIKSNIFASVSHASRGSDGSDRVGRTSGIGSRGGAISERPALEGIARAREAVGAESDTIPFCAGLTRDRAGGISDNTTGAI